MIVRCEYCGGYEDIDGEECAMCLGTGTQEYEGAALAGYIAELWEMIDG